MPDAWPAVSVTVPVKVSASCVSVPDQVPPKAVGVVGPRLAGAVGLAVAAGVRAVAAGQVDAYYEQGVQYWDIAAGALIAREAGARTGGLHGLPAGPDLTIAAADGLFADLHDLLAEARAAGESAAG